MTATTLSSKIEELARIKAENRAREIYSKISAAIKPYWYAAANGSSGAYCGLIVKAIVAQRATSRNDFLELKDIDLSVLVEHYRTEILDEVLKKLPLVQELNTLMSEETNGEG